MSNDANIKKTRRASGAVLLAKTPVRINGASIGQPAALFLIERAQGRAVNPRIVDVGFSIIKHDTS